MIAHDGARETSGNHVLEEEGREGDADDDNHCLQQSSNNEASHPKASTADGDEVSVATPAMPSMGKPGPKAPL